jgi:acid phosphatase
MFSVACIGDFGHNTTAKKKLLSGLSRLPGLDFLIGLGDNFYPTGIDHDSMWDTHFYRLVTPRVPWFMIMGNHDHLGSSQIRVHHPWIMPHYYYHVLHKDVLFVFLDTFWLSLDQSRLQTRAMRRDFTGFAEVFSVNRNRQIRWLVDVLRQHPSVPVVVCGHYPILSNGAHGNNRELYGLLMPIFRSYPIRAYISGHDHSLQHIYRDGIHFLVSGAGSETRPRTYGNGNDFYYSGTCGYLRLDLDARTFRFCFCDEDHHVLHWITI